MRIMCSTRNVNAFHSFESESIHLIQITNEKFVDFVISRLQARKEKQKAAKKDMEKHKKLFIFCLVKFIFAIKLSVLHRRMKLKRANEKNENLFRWNQVTSDNFFFVAFCAYFSFELSTFREGNKNLLLFVARCCHDFSHRFSAFYCFICVAKVNELKQEENAMKGKAKEKKKIRLLAIWYEFCLLHVLHSLFSIAISYWMQWKQWWKRHF